MKQGHVEASYQLGLCYENGNGIGNHQDNHNHNHNLAFIHFKYAADQHQYNELRH